MFHKYKSHAFDLFGLSQSWFSCFFSHLSSFIQEPVVCTLTFPSNSLFLVALRLILLEQTTYSVSWRSQLTSPVLHVCWLIRKTNQRRISFFEALLGMAEREVQKKPRGMSPETLFHIVLFLLTQNWFTLLDRVFLKLLHLPFHQQLHLEGLCTYTDVLLLSISYSLSDDLKGKL